MVWPKGERGARIESAPEGHRTDARAARVAWGRNRMARSPDSVVGLPQPSVRRAAPRDDRARDRGSARPAVGAFRALEARRPARLRLLHRWPQPEGRELAANPEAALAWYWDALGKQVRVEGRVSEVATAEADATGRRGRVRAGLRPRSHDRAQRSDAPCRSPGALAGARTPASRRRGAAPGRRGRAIGSYHARSSSGPAATSGLHHRERFERRRGGWTRRLLQP